MRKKFNKFNYLLGKIHLKRDYKDRLFRFIFRNKKDLLELYNAVNGTNYDNPEDITITTIEDVIYISMKNDLSFVIGYYINLYEHQSTFNPNMPIRGLSYFARLYEDYIAENNLNVYSSSAISLPKPQYIVFYYGSKDLPDEMELNLSDLFSGADDGMKPAIECSARMLNLNYGHNKELLKKCRKLYEYSYFMNKVRVYLDKDNKPKDAVRFAMDDCINHNILGDVFKKFKNEVFDMFLTEFDEKAYKKGIYNDGFTDGMEQGMEQGMERGYDIGSVARLVSQVRCKIKRNKSVEQIIDELEGDDELVMSIYQIIISNPKKKDDKIAENILNNNNK